MANSANNKIIKFKHINERINNKQKNNCSNLSKYTVKYAVILANNAQNWLWKQMESVKFLYSIQPAISLCTFI